MSFESNLRFETPPEVSEMLARYRTLLEQRGLDWGDDQVDLFRWGRFWPDAAVGSSAFLGTVFAAVSEAAGNWPKAVSNIVGPQPPAGTVLVRITDAGLEVTSGPSRPGIARGTVPIDVVIDSLIASDATVTVADRSVIVAAGGAAVETIEVDGGAATFHVGLDGESVAVTEAVRSVARAQLRLSSPRCTRWSVTDASGGAWFPQGVLHKWDVHHRPFFHGADLHLEIPAEPLTVACTRGIEHERIVRRITPGDGESISIECDPQPLFDPRAEGWYGGDLHIHMNYGGDLVCELHDAARMQLGEGLDLANFVAANCQTSLVYDTTTLAHYVGHNLPWSSEETIASMGAEYRNDLLGHVVAFAPDNVPSQLYSGHERSDSPTDRPPNKTACDELRRLGAAVVYPHPVFSAFPDDGSPDAFFATPRSVEARELVVDAALGAVDAIDVLSPFDDEAAIFLYHRLLSCGLRLAATAGTDSFLSFSHGPGVASNPPGWCRVYAQLEDRQLTVNGFKDAIRKGRTVATNGPWLTLTVNGHGPGAVLDLRRGQPIEISAQVRGIGVERLAIVGAEGTIEESSGSSIDLTHVVQEPTWIAAIARGPGHPNLLDVAAIAHTSPVYIDHAGRRVGRQADARWCINLLDGTEKLIEEHGNFDADAREHDLARHRALISQARDFYTTVSTSTERPGVMRPARPRGRTRRAG